MTREQAAVKKASRARILADMRMASQLMPFVRPPQGSAWARGYVLGLVEATSSLTVRACLLTAFGG